MPVEAPLLPKHQWVMCVNIGDNYVSDVSTLTEGNFPKLKNLWIYELKEDKNTFCDPFFPFKLEACRMQNLCNHCFI